MSGIERIAALPAHIVALLTTPEPATVVAYRSVWDDDESKIRRGRGYIAKAGTALLGERNNKAFGVAAFLTHDLALSIDDARSLLHEMNASWPAPLSAREIEQALASAIKHGKRAFGVADALSSHRPFARVTTTATTTWWNP